VIGDPLRSRRLAPVDNALQRRSSLGGDLVPVFSVAGGASMGMPVKAWPPRATLTVSSQKNPVFFTQRPDVLRKSPQPCHDRLRKYDRLRPRFTN
jgi:hypothetical protein